MRRVVITGMGLVTPIGTGRAMFWERLTAGANGIGPVQSFDTTGYSAHLGAEVKDFDPSEHVRTRPPEALGRGSQLAVAAARMALEDSGVDLTARDRYRIGVSMGTTSGEPQMVERYNDARKAGGLESVSADILPKYPCNVIPSHVAVEFDLHGPCLMIPTACAAGNYAIGYGFDMIRTGRTDMMLAGGADSFSRITYSGFARLGAIAPERCQPFDKHRKGMVPGEGSAMLVLEPLEDAIARGATIYAEVLGYGVSCDAHHMTAAHPQGDGAIRAMAMALKDSRKTTGDVDYISAHGTGTPTNDRVEAIAVRTLFAERAPKIPMSSIKSMIGHTMGAASAIEAVACSLALHTGVIPPTMNFTEPDEGSDLDYVPNQARKTDPQIVLNNAYAFGGNNASLCLARVQ
ncbi:MAG TPA: beta-ketoacyl-[acyl-carrier-protein] synthase family protein [Bryobacteraceae bacterium]|jgi:3-oxoacyl-[acyl-carrier-protein] synthase II|nr:beta-ketoacyl-[acyl-carrier-protein] synthase family protein [Bryobacteraceae bacterium]